MVKKSNLTKEQWNLVRSDNFINWFGDWINEPENSSKVVDENGEPLVVYHGTNTNFNIFKPSKKEGSHNEKDQFGGIYFTDSYKVADWYALHDKFIKIVF